MSNNAMKVKAFKGNVSAWLIVGMLATPAFAADGTDAPLATAAMNRDLDTVRALLAERGADVNAMGPYATPALHWIVRIEDIELAKRLLDAGYPLTGASDHGVSEALYLDDPDGNGVELYRDRPRKEWPSNADGSLEMYTHALDLEDLLRLAD